MRFRSVLRYLISIACIPRTPRRQLENTTPQVAVHSFHGRGRIGIKDLAEILGKSGPHYFNISNLNQPVIPKKNQTNGKVNPY